MLQAHHAQKSTVIFSADGPSDTYGGLFATAPPPVSAAGTATKRKDLFSAAADDTYDEGACVCVTIPVGSGWVWTAVVAALVGSRFALECAQHFIVVSLRSAGR